MSPQQRQRVRELQDEVRAAAMQMTVQTSRDDRRIAERHEGPAGWDAAYRRFDTAMSALEQLRGSGDV